jgi:tRNA(Ile)-lysidine synthase
MDLLAQFKANWKSKAFAAEDQKVLLAVSGGMDSMVMADLFLRSGISFGIAHCNFQLRGEDAEKDQQHVQSWADEYNIPFYTTRFNTQETSENWKRGIQETARILRYEWLDEIRAANGYKYIATAHHANDNAETLLMNLFKGTGISGLHGIPEKTETLIRPLLFAQRQHIQDYASSQKLSFREDVSNSSDKYLRNAVRLNIIPVIEKYFPNVVSQLIDSIHRFNQVEELYLEAIDAKLKKLVDKRGNDLYIPVLKFMKAKPLEAIAYELFRQYGFTAAQVPHIIELAGSGSGHFIESASHKVIKDRDFLIITTRSTTDTDFITIEGVPCTIQAGRHNFHFADAKNSKVIPSTSHTAYIDASNITFPLILRKWRTGDYFYPLGMGMKKKKLSRFLIDQKIPIHEKENVWVLECQKRIVWVSGMRLDERFKVKPETQRVLRVEMQDGQ